MSTSKLTTKRNSKVAVNVTPIISAELEASIIAAYELRKAAEAEAEAIKAAEAAAAEAAEAEAIKAAEAAEAAEAKKAEAKRIRDGRKDVDNDILNSVLKPTEVLKLIDSKYGLNKDVSLDYWLDKLISLNLIKSVQITALNYDYLSELIKSLSLVLAQMSNEDLTKFSEDNCKLMPSKYLSLIVNGSCKSKKAFQNSKDKLAAFQAKK